VRSAFIHCEDWKNLFPVGSTVKTELRFETDSDVGTSVDYWRVVAIVCGTVRDKLLLWPTEDSDEMPDHIFIRKYADDLTAVDASIVTVCPACHKPHGYEARTSYWSESGQWICDACGVTWDELIRA